MAWYVYVARCRDDTLYCGIARDVAARIAAHDAGTGARYTRGRGPLQVLLTRRCLSHGRALRLEYSIKQLTRIEKEALVARPALVAAMAERLARAASVRRAAVPRHGGAGRRPAAESAG